MTSLSSIENNIDSSLELTDARAAAAQLLWSGELILKNWIRARGEEPQKSQREGFRLLALHRQGCRGEPSFNACRETARELVYYYNLVQAAGNGTEADRAVEMMGHVARHLYLFVSGKMRVAELGEFCCSSKPLHVNSEESLVS